MFNAAATGALTGSLLAAGLTSSSWMGERSVGGLSLGLSGGYLLGAALAPFWDVKAARGDFATGGSVIGGAIGLGTTLLLRGADDRDDAGHLSMGAGLGASAFALAGFAAAPYVHPGPQAVSMTLARAMFGGGSFFAAALAGSSAEGSAAPFWGGLLATTMASTTGAWVASTHFRPARDDYFESASLMAIGFSAGLGVARLTLDEKGLGDTLMALSGSALGFAGGAVAAHYVSLKPPVYLATASGAAFAGLYGMWLPHLGADVWTNDRPAQGAGLLALSLGAATAGTVAQLTNATSAQVFVGTTAATLGNHHGRRHGAAGRSTRLTRRALGLALGRRYVGHGRLG